MSTEENYLDNLLKAISEPKPGVPAEGEGTGENGDREAAAEPAEVSDAAASDMGADLDAADGADGLALPDLDGDLAIPDTFGDSDLSEDDGDLDDIADILEAAGDLDLSDDSDEPDISEMPDITGDLDNISEDSGVWDTPESTGAPEAADTDGALEIPDTADDLAMPDMAGDLEMPDTADDLAMPDMAGDLEIPDTADDLTIPDMAGDLEIPDITDDLTIPDIADDLAMPDMTGDLEIPDITDDLTIPDDIGDLSIPNITDELAMADLPESGEGTAAAENEEPLKEISIDGLDAAIAEATELAMASELDIKELEVGDNDELKLEDIEIPDAAGNQESDKEVSDALGIDAEELGIPDDMLADDGLDEVLNMLDADSDSDLAEINNMLKKSDNNEPIQDDMMDLLNQMADNEAAFINAEDGVAQGQESGLASADVDADGGVGQEPVQEDAAQGKKKASKKKGGSAEDGAQDEKKPGVFGKLFNALTEDLVPEPTEAELEAEKAAKEAKKQENLTKKEEEKAAREEEKKAKAKAEEAEKKKKEKQAAKEARRAAKKAKEEAAGPKPKRIPPKKFAIGAAFGISVGGAILVASSVLSTQGSLQKAKNAYYEGDYKTAYLATYGMELNDTDNQLIQKRSETISKLQRRYDAYETNLKMGREVEALNALLEGITTYDYINVDAEQYGVLTEVDTIKNDILNTLYTKYGLDEESARTLLQVPDSLTYTMALYAIVNGN